MFPTFVPKIYLRIFEQRIYSQSGEDGIIDKIFNLLHIEEGYFVEFGAWDGVRLSNSRNLVENGWPGLLIEADPKKFADLEKKLPAPKYPE